MSDPQKVIQVEVAIRDKSLATHHFHSDELLIGRAANADIVLDNPGVSRRHATILHSSEGLVIRDLGSGNGTFVNGEPIAQRLLEPGDRVGLSKFSLTVALVAAAENAGTASSSPPSPAPSEDSADGTVVLKPEDCAKILQQSEQKLRAQASPAAPSDTATRSSRADKQPSIFIAGLVLGFLLGWLIFA